MPGRILTEVTATVDTNREPELVAGFRELLNSPLPDGLLRSELLHGQEGQWRIQTLWHDREALDALLAGPEPPPAGRLFRNIGAEPSLQVFEIEADHLAAPSGG
jgi:hypothetical protein